MPLLHFAVINVAQYSSVYQDAIQNIIEHITVGIAVVNMAVLSKYFAEFALYD